MADHAVQADDSSIAVSPSLRAQLAPLLESLSSCEPSSSDDLLVFFHACVDAAIGHAHSFAAFSPALAQHAAAFTRLVALLASTITPSTDPTTTFNALRGPLPTALSSPLSLCLSTRHPALLAAAQHAAAAITPAGHLAAFDLSARLIAASSHIAALNQPTALLTLHCATRGGAGDGTGAGAWSVELSVEQLDGLLGKFDEVAKLLQSTAG